jgi:hypothetical protein
MKRAEMRKQWIPESKRRDAYEKDENGSTSAEPPEPDLPEIASLVRNYQ